MAEDFDCSVVVRNEESEDLLVNLIRSRDLLVELDDGLSGNTGAVHTLSLRFLYPVAAYNFAS